MSLKQIVAVALVDSLLNPTMLLAARRNRPAELAGQWEFPGGKVEAGEEVLDALHREIREELGIGITVGEEIYGPLDQGWQLNDKAAMRVWFAVISDGTPEPLDGHDELRWLALDDEPGEQVPWIPVDAPIVAACVADAKAPVGLDAN